MQPVVCATRGGEACRRTQERAIHLAKEKDAPLIFLYVADPDLVGPVSEPLEEALRQETARLGRALLRVAQERARKQGLTAQAVVIHGPVQQSIQDYLQQVEADTLVLGAPRVGAAPQVFTAEGIEDFAEAVRQETEVEVIVVT
jgi:nucleotide-binding universal stress UspA family protein